ncbi:GL10370 [Drosophila persimilis]|uniref:GL10370 n=1 Tax=Drosophila persimilis TaxID=7234 RepID=B4GD78_DROPE|nr:GL10370 [Drosophila persimilis]
MILTFCLLGMALALAYNFFRNTYSYWERKGVPNERPLPLIGNVKGIGTKYHFRDINQRIYDKFKGVAPFAGMFTFFKRSALIIDLDLIKQVLIKDFQYFQDRGVFNNVRDDPLTGHLLTLEGDEWRSMRQKLTPVFTSGKIKHMSGVVVEVGHRLAAAMDKAVSAAMVDDGDVEIKDICARFTTDVIGTCAFGLECHSLSDPKAEFRSKGRMIFEKPRHSPIVQFFVFTNAKLAKKLRMKLLPDDVSEFFMNAVKNTVDYRMKNGIKRNDFLDELIELRAENQEAAKQGKVIDLSHGLTIEQMAAQAFVFFLAGFETSSSTMAYCLYELAQHPDIQRRVREEIDAVLKNVEGGEITYDALAEMNYLEKVLAVHSIHHDPEIYPQPEHFDPSRFEADQVKSRHPMAYLPFGDGPRNCIGLRFGKIQAKIGLVSLLRRFKFGISKRTESPLILDTRSFPLTTKNGIHLRVERI